IDAGADGITAINTVGPVLHVDPASGKPILQNALGGKGGKSGSWVYDRAIEAIREIRAAVGDKVPIIGMGGVSSKDQCTEMIRAGADAVGIGSALAHIRQQDWPAFFRSMTEDLDVPRKDGRVMEYRAHTVTGKRLHCEDTLLLTLEDKSRTMASFKAGEFVFLWIPGTGEKPFSVAMTEPLTFIIKKRGPFTEAVFNSIQVGDTIMLRGPYGAEVDVPKAKKAIIIAGGTGEAVAYPLAQKLKENGTPMSFLVGTSVDGNNGILSKELSEFGRYICVSDNGKPGRILDSLDEEISLATSDGTDISDVAFYLIGPEIFMKIASGKIKAKGVEPDMILLSMERNSMCGIGLCGECSCGGHLACQWGTFMRLSFLEEENVL
ncbi:MAG: dihydroorotate dehydrogenase, partial [Spirochaetales bacterium]|nr:dihydroorotate dehydrogenase [Spirochaetales bacterium]